MATAYYTDGGGENQCAPHNRPPALRDLLCAAADCYIASVSQFRSVKPFITEVRQILPVNRVLIKGGDCDVKRCANRFIDCSDLCAADRRRAAGARADAAATGAPCASSQAVAAAARARYALRSRLC